METIVATIGGIVTIINIFGYFFGGKERGKKILNIKIFK